jgi:hypothetical protein
MPYRNDSRFVFLYGPRYGLTHYPKRRFLDSFRIADQPPP